MAFKKTTPTTTELTDLERIYNDVSKARTKVAKRRRVKINWTPQELAEDMLTVSENLIKDLKKFLRTGMKEPARRIRKNSKVLETLGLSFRVQSTK